MRKSRGRASLEMSRVQLSAQVFWASAAGWFAMKLLWMILMGVAVPLTAQAQQVLLEAEQFASLGGDMYAAKLGAFIHDKWQIPTVVSNAEAARLCVTLQIAIDKRMIIWNVRMEPIKKSGNDLFDDSARLALQKLLDERTPLPDPPPELDASFRGRTIQIVLTGDMHGDSTKCR